MKNKILPIVAIMSIAACTSRTNPFMEEWNTPYGTAPFDKIQISDYKPAILQGIEESKAEVAAIAANQEAPDYENTIAALDRSGALLSKVTGVFYNIAESDATPEVNAIMEEITPLVSEASDEIFMNADLFTRVKVVYENRESLTREQQRSR